MFGGVFSWSNVLYERVYPGGDLLIQFVGRDAYKQFWNFSKDEKENLATQLAIELPALRGKVGASQEEIASAVGISRQTYSAYENRTRPIPWSLYLALLFYFDYIRTLWGVQTVAFCFNGSSSFPLSLSLFPALSACRYSKSFQPSVWQSAVLLSLF